MNDEQGSDTTEQQNHSDDQKTSEEILNEILPSQNPDGAAHDMNVDEDRGMTVMSMEVTVSSQRSSTGSPLFDDDSLGDDVLLAAGMYT